MSERDYLIAQMLSNVTGAVSQSGATPNVGMSALSSGLSAGATGFTLGGPIGGAIGLIGGGVAGAIGASNQKRQTEMAEKRAKTAQDSARLASYPTNGINSTLTYYRNGGIMKKYANGGIASIGMTGGRAVGPSHERGGVAAGNNVEVEGGETKHSKPNYDVWFSNDLKTPNGIPFSEAAEELLVKKANYEKGLHSKSTMTRQKAQRALDKLNGELDQLQSMQKDVQIAKGLPTNGEVAGVGVRKANSGGTFSRIAPYLDNVVNTVVTAATPSVPAPILQDPINLDTDYNVTDQLENERRGLNQMRLDVDRNVSSSAIGRTNKLAASAAGMSRQNQILGNKERIETQLQNQETSANYQTQARNIDATNRFNQQKAARADQMGSNISANAANAVDDFITQETEDRLRQKDMATMELLKKKYQDLGIWDRNIAGAFESYLAGNITYEEFIQAKNRKPVGQVAPLPNKPLGSIGSKLGKNLAGEQMARQIDFTRFNY